MTGLFWFGFVLATTGLVMCALLAVACVLVGGRR